MLAVAVVVGSALLCGLLANRRVRPFAESEIQGVKLETLVAPLVSLAVVLMAFTLVTVFASFQRAAAGASDEARKVDHQYEMAGYLGQPEGEQVAAATTCYALAVMNYEWTTMREGRTAPEVSPWTRMMHAGYNQMAANETYSPVASLLLTADRDRGEARSRRLTEARPAIPLVLVVLLVLTASAGVFALATFTLPYVHRGVQIGVLGLLAASFVLMLGVMRDLDQPYDGLAVVPNTDIARVAGDLLEDFAEDYPSAALPCDDTGRQLTAPG